jgi:GNAT superfamily N-acetyltransferase
VSRRRLIPSLSPHLSWAGERGQYDRPEINNRLPGIHHWTVPAELVDGTVIECLLHYSADPATGGSWSRDGVLTGILNYFPHGSPFKDEPGDVLVLVDPAHQRAGIGTALLREAVRRWQVDLHNQALTPAGVALTRSLEQRASAP